MQTVGLDEMAVLRTRWIAVNVPGIDLSVPPPFDRIIDGDHRFAIGRYHDEKMQHHASPRTRLIVS
jgi:hypothetical protein